VSTRPESLPLVSVVIPCFNEAENIPTLATRVHDVFKTLEGYDYECLFVDDGSTDDTPEVLRALSVDDPNIRPLRLVRNAGQSAALVAGLQHARGDLILTLDGDLQNDPRDFPKFLELLETYDCVCGYRAIRNDTWIRRVSSRAANAVRNGILHDGVRDSGCGAKGFRRACLSSVVPFNGVHRFLPALIRQAGFTLVEWPVVHHPRTHGVSKYGIHNRLWRGLYDLIGVAWLQKRVVRPEVSSQP
jgi:dolichol-phosphate mannosyltransferase